MIELRLIPADRVMAGAAIALEATVVRIVLAVAINTGLGSIPENL
jgi:hypothetical protein